MEGVSLGGRLWGFQSSSLSLPVDQDVKLSATATAPCLPASHHDANMLMDQPLESVSKSPLGSVFSYTCPGHVVSLLNRRTMTKPASKKKRTLYLQKQVCVRR